jgi:4-hydroxybenzoate polyprenyltransferase
MRTAATKPLSFATLLKLGRISNLPTVWTNVLAGTVLAGGVVQHWQTGIVLLAMSLLYVSGMYLNDYFDRAIDARERPQRPIPAGDVSAATVAVFGFGMLGLGVTLVAATGIPAGLTGAMLALVIILYDAFHKGYSIAPLIMGLCRGLLYCGAAAAAVGNVPSTVVIAALALLAYVAGLTYAARQESLDRVGNLWPLLILIAPILLAVPALGQGLLAILVYLSLVACTAYSTYLLVARPLPGAVSRAVGILIAGISLADAALLASVDAVEAALGAALGFPATLLLQKYIPGT